MAVRTNLVLPGELVRRVDRLAGRRGRSRFVAEVLEREVRRAELRAAVLDGAGMLRGRPGYDHWSTPDRVVEWVDAIRAADREAGPG